MRALSSTLTPIQAASERWQRGLCWLDSADGSGPGYLLSDPVFVLSAAAGAPGQLVGPEGTVLASGDPLDLLEALLAELAELQPPRDWALPFAGGVAGVLNYELGRRWEDWRSQPRDDLQLPDLWLAVHRELIAFPAAGPPLQLTLPLPAPHRIPAPWASVPFPPGGPVAGWPGVQSCSDGAFHRDEVDDLVRAIHRGDLFQANLTQRLTTHHQAHPLTLYRRLRERLKPRFGALLALPTPILSASPERFLMARRDEGGLILRSEPIKGTRPRGRTPEEDRQLAEELRASAKDRGENLMIVDLLRNDLSRVCQPGTVTVPRLVGLDPLPAVHHLVSEIEGRVEPRVGIADILRATFPGGSITGAPKVQAMREIARREPVVRGPYCGSIGWFGPDGAFDLSIAIRTGVMRGEQLALGVGGGIVADSEPQAEYEESLVKGHALLEALLERPLIPPSQL